ncbi:MAG: hypothetical protein ACI8TX_000454 [Hyphomicrobiaceae bacterium]|jgi:hypothetical protein
MIVKASTNRIDVCLGLMVGLSALAVASCSQPGPLGSDFGDAVRMANASQTLNPAPADLEVPVDEHDGVAVQNTRTAYQKSFEVTKDERPTAVFSFGGK